MQSRWGEVLRWMPCYCYAPWFRWMPVLAMAPGLIAKAPAVLLDKFYHVADLHVKKDVQGYMLLVKIS